MVGAGAPLASIFARWMECLGLDGLVAEDELKEAFEESLDILDRVNHMLESESTLPEDAWSTVQSEIKRVSPSCYEKIAKLAKANSKCWRDEMTWTINEHSGRGAWVKKENAHHWKHSTG
jgi:hypothetical protein